MNILCVGDVVGKAGRKALNELLPGIIQEYKVDLTIINAENAAGGSGITPRIAEQLFRFGAQSITLGDHAWDRPELMEYFGEEPRILRPANFPPDVSGRGWHIVQTAQGVKVGIINLLGRVFMRYNVDCPFRKLSDILEEVRKETNIIVVDFHAEATSEKVALGHFSDGKVSVVFGTHTHIQTADEKILPQGTAYITDVGMTGPYDSVIGQNKEKIIKRFLTSIPCRFEVSQEDPWLAATVVCVEEKSGKASQITRIQRRLE